MTEENIRYFEQRAAAQAALALEAASPKVADIHRQLVTLYRDRVATAESASTVNA